MIDIRNVAIIAHVDHGKTTLVDALLRQSKVKLDKEVSQSNDLIMDSNDLERERGITIFSKNASVIWNGTKINIIDTPGHADFGGEVERVLKMADGCLLLIDAKEGPMPQTRFVLKKALEMKHKIIVVVNKIDREDARVDFVVNKTFDLFLELGADEETAFFPVIYASGKLGKAGKEADISKMVDITPIFESILEYIPAPQRDIEKPLQMLVTTISGDNFKGRIATGKILCGTISSGEDIAHINHQGEIKRCRVTSLMTYEGLERVDVAKVEAGDIVAVGGIADVTIGDTIADVANPKPLPVIDIEQPTVKMTFSANTSPFAGREGVFKTSRQVRDRLYKELETDVALRVEDTAKGDWIVSGRGELHLAILIERMRREGYEFQVSRPRVVEKIIDGKTFTPYEKVLIEVPDLYSGIVMQKMGERHAEMLDMRSDDGITIFEFIVATKELFGYRSEFLSDTRGLGIINVTFLEYRKDDGVRYERKQGSLVAFESGSTSLYGLLAVQDRGVLFLNPGISVYKGEVVGQNSRFGDIRVNVCKEKQLTNHRSKGEGVSEHFNSPKIMDLEDALGYIDDTELVEVTPKSVRIRKIILDEAEEKRLMSQGLKERTSN